VDKCSIGLVYSKTPQGDDLPHGDVGALIAWAHSVKDGEFSAISGGSKGTYKCFKPPVAYTRVTQPLPSGNSLRCQYGCHKGVYRAWVGLNPTLSHLGEINFHLQCMFVQGFETLRRHGAMAECEFFVDFDNAAYDDYVYIDTALRSGCPKYSTQGTTYLGSRHGKRSTTVYDKAKHLAETQGVYLSSPRLRIEGKVRGSVHRLKAITAVPNPFSTFHVIELAALAELKAPAAVELKKLLGWGMSAQASYGCLSKAHKIEIADVFLQARPAWWHPAAAWESVLANLGWMSILSLAGITGEYLPMGDAAYQGGN
jgi:hypothetical protein